MISLSFRWTMCPLANAGCDQFTLRSNLFAGQFEAGVASRLYQLEPAPLDIAVRCELGIDEEPIVVEDEVAVALLHHERRTPSGLGRHLVAHPPSFAGAGVQPP